MIFFKKEFDEKENNCDEKWNFESQTDRPAQRRRPDLVKEEIIEEKESEKFEWISRPRKRTVYCDNCVQPSLDRSE